MIKRLRITVDGERSILERLRSRLSADSKLEHYPRCSTLRIFVVEGSEEHGQAERAIQQTGMPFYCDATIEASVQELRTEPVLANVFSTWIDDCDPFVDAPKYAGSDVCDSCGRGAMQLSRPLKGEWGKFRKRHFLRYPPALIIVSSSLAATIERIGWTGASLQPVLERSTGQESKRCVQLVITSILPLMHPSAPIERSPIPEFCAVCRKLGYRLKGAQPSYSRDILACAADFNFSSEWLSEHYVSCPQLICSGAVVSQLLKLERAQRWVPIQWM